MREQEPIKANKVSSLTRFTAVLAGVALAAACSPGRGSEITSCGNDGTPVVATFQGDKDYLKQTDPAFLARFADLNRASAPEDPDDKAFVGRDVADKVGEIACKTKDGTLVLTGPGAELSSLYLESQQHDS